MKTLKSLLMLCAGLSFCACSSDNEPQLPEGKGKVVVRIVPPTSTRAVVDATEQDGASTTQLLTGTYTIKLYAGSGDQSEEFTPSEENEFLTFEGVTSPTKVTVSLHGGKADYSNLEQTPYSAIAELDASDVPAYGETTDFSQITTSTTNSGTTITYNVSVPMAIPVARLEVGPIKLKDGEESFSQLSVAGIYLDKLRNAGGKYLSAEEKDESNEEQVAGAFNCKATNVVDYQFATGGSGSSYIVGTAVSNADLLTATLPSEEQAYAYNFYGATPGQHSTVGNPQFKIYFNETKLATDPAGVAPVARYAMIKDYKKGGQSIKLENGKIYRITDVELLDKNIVADEEGNQVAFNVSVEVEEASWSIEYITGEWGTNE